MVKYVLYEIETGRILQSGFCPSDDCLPEKVEGSELITGVMVTDIEANRVVNGKIVKVS